MPAWKQVPKVCLQGYQRGGASSVFSSPVYAAVNEHFKTIQILQYECVNKLGTYL